MYRLDEVALALGTKITRVSHMATPGGNSVLNPPFPSAAAELFGLRAIVLADVDAEALSRSDQTFKPVKFTSSFRFSLSSSSMVSRIPRRAASRPRIAVSVPSTARWTVGLSNRCSTMD